MKKDRIKLPPCGAFVGSPVYLDRGDYIFQTSGKYYTSWISEDHDVSWYIERFVKDNQGNLVAIWDGGASKRALKSMAEWMALEELASIPDPDWDRKKYLVPGDWDLIKKHPERLGAGLVKMVKQAQSHDLYSYTIYTDAAPGQLKRLAKLGSSFLGCNIGEKFSFRLDGEDNAAMGDHPEFDLKKLASNFVQSVRDCVSERINCGWNRVLTTSGSFHLDYEVIGGITVPVIEDFAFQHLNIASAMARGYLKQFDLPTWGTNLAHEHYSWQPYSSKYKFPMLTQSLYLKYMSGCKILLLESGIWWQQSDHVEDTPMHNVPKVDLGGIHNTDPHRSAPYVKEARKHYKNINYNSSNCRKYRKIMSDFYDFVKENGTPDGQPEIRIAGIKGNLDLSSQDFSPNMAVAGAYKFAEKDPRWYEAAPERGWNIFKKVFYPRRNTMGQYLNPFFSGTPYGMTDIVSFAAEPDADFLCKNYKSLLFTGWNTATKKQYSVLTEYVRRGGTLFVSIPHLSTNSTRNYLDYGVKELVNGGDFSELCGVKVKSRGRQFYWATMPKSDNIFAFPRARKFGVFLSRLGELEITGKPEVIAVEDEEFRPLLLLNRLGKGKVYFLNTWEYPGAMENNEGPGALLDNVGFIGEVFKKIAMDCQGPVRISDDGVGPGSECSYIAYSHFESNGKTYLLNNDFDKAHTFFLHRGKKMDKIKLKATEFRVI